MNEITGVLKIVNTAIKIVRVIDVTKKAVVAAAIAGCCIFAVRLWRK